MSGPWTFTGPSVVPGAGGGGRQAPNHEGRSVARPLASTVWLDSTQLPGPPVFTVIRSGEPGPVSPIEIPSSRSRSNVTVCSAVGARCARTQVGTAICTKMTTARVMAIAGSVRRSTAPRVAPSTTANTAYPTGTMPRIANDTGVRRDGRLP